MHTPDSPLTDEATLNQEDVRQEFEALAGDLAVKIMADPNLQSLFQTIVKSILTSWAGRNPLKRMSAAMAARAIPKVPPPSGDPKGAGVAADLGRLIMCHWKIRATGTRKDPHAAGEQLAASLREFLENTDFSQWKTMIETGRESRINQFQAVNELLPDYNGKMLVVLATLPALISIGANGLKSFFDTQLQTMPPDMLFEVGGGVNKQVDWKEVGRMLNDYHELIKRIQVGSALSGEGETPAIQSLTADILGDIAGALDPEKLVAAGTAAARNREALDNGISDAMADNPVFGKALFSSRTQTLNARMRAAKNRLQVVSGFPEETFRQLLEEVDDDFEALELADLITVFIDILGRVQETKPQLIPDILTRAVQSLDMEGLERDGSILIREVFETVKPLLISLFRPLTPSLIHTLCDLLSPNTDEDYDEHHNALKAATARLGNILGGENAD